MNSINWIVFSRNRPYQLTAFLRSAQLVGGLDLTKIAVVHRYDELFLEGLATVKHEIAEPYYIEQKVWLDSLEHAVSLCGETMCFATDDSIFVRKCQWDIGDQTLRSDDRVLAFCHRYGLHLSYCFVQDKPVSTPDGFLKDGVFFWNWLSCGQMWDFLGSVDAHQFRTKDIIKWIGDSKSPNTLEEQLHRANKIGRPLGACLPLACYVTIPANRVQNDHPNRFSGESVEAFNERYIRGQRPLVEKFAGYVNSSTHELLKI